MQSQKNVEASPSTLSSFEEFALYNGTIPGSISTANLEYVREAAHPDAFIMNVTHPSIRAYIPNPQIANGTSVIILPGGGYAGVSIVKEGYQVAERLRELGVTAFVLKYRMPLAQSMQDKTTGPLQDAQQAIHWVRSQAPKWHLNPHKVGIMGFSAGGHLAASAAILYKQAINPALEGENLRPDFQILVYPVISFEREITHLGSRDKLIGPQPNPQQVQHYSIEKQVSDSAPPAFIVHAGDDVAVPVENSLSYYRALHKRKISTQMLIVPSGGHGFGLRNEYDWFANLAEWLGNMGLL
ncbi:MAG: alpha/beta hydrolase [Paraglaciecola sp.]|nr:alpha/beta hydrolase [Paraglaciecola sp.]